MWRFYKGSIIFVGLFVFVIYSSDFWNENKACYWETNCQQNKTKLIRKKDWKKRYEALIEKILKYRDKYLNELPPSKIKELYNKVKELAIAYPTEKNLEAFTYMTDYIRRKSIQFMYAYTHFIAEHPEFNISAKVGTTSWGYRTMQVAKFQRVEKWLLNHSDRVGLYFVCTPQNQLCLEASRVVRKIAQKGIPVVSVSPVCDERFPNCTELPDVFKKFKVKVIPAYYLFLKTEGKPKVVPLGQGLIPVDRLIYEMFRLANYELKGQWIDATQYLY